MDQKEYVERAALLKDLELLAKYQVGERQQGILGVCETIRQRPTADVVEVVRCKECELSSEPAAVSRLDLYCNNYDVRFCEKDKKIVCGTHFCSYGTRSDSNV